MTLPTDIASGGTTSGHHSHHDTLHGVYNGWANFYQAQFVDPANGSSSNSGDNPGEATDTIENAYGNLGDAGGVIYLAPHQDHDVGAGLTLDRRKHVSLVSAARPRRSRGDATRASTCPRIYSSTGAATLIDFATPASSVNGAGFEFVNIDFIPSTTTTVCIDGTAVGFVRVENCGAYHDYDDSTQNAFTFIDVDAPGTLGDDNGWWRITDNYVRGGALSNAAGDQVNQWRIVGNVAFPINSTADAIYIENGHRCVIRDNNLEGAGWNSGIYLKSSYACRIDGDAGELTDPFVILDGSNGCLLTPMGISNAGSATLVRFTNGSGDNVVVASVATGLSDLYNTAAWIDDQTTNKENAIFGASGNVTNNNIYKQRVLGLYDGKTVPATVAGVAFLYVDSADGDLKVKFGDGTVKTIAADT